MALEVEPGKYSKINFKTHVVLRSKEASSSTGTGIKPPTLEFVVLRDACRLSNTLSNKLCALPKMAPGKPVIIPVDVESPILKYVVQYLEHHCYNRAKRIEKPMKKKITHYISDWDKQFLYTDLVKNGDEREHELLIEVTKAAKQLDIQDLLDLTTACLASMLMGSNFTIFDIFFWGGGRKLFCHTDKEPSEVRQLFKIESSGYTPEQEWAIRQEILWSEEG